MSKYLILGSGIAGISAASEFAQAGHEVALLERGSSPGGSILAYCCKATDSCVRCGVCVAHTKIRETLAHPRVTLSTGIGILSGAASDLKISIQVERKNPYINLARCVSCGLCVETCPEQCISRYSRGGLYFYAVDFSSCRLRRGTPCTACAEVCPTRAITADGPVTRETFTGDGMVVATGHTHFQAEKKPRYGYGRLPGVLTGLEAEERLIKANHLVKPGEKVAFIQCVGSRDPEINRNYCSAVCCAYALRMANVLAYRNKGADITVYYIDLQNFDKVFPTLLSDIRGRGVKLERGLPFKAEASADGRISLQLLQENDGLTSAEYDAVVLSVGMGADADASGIAARFGLDSDEFGFLSGAGENVVTAGTCREPQSITDTMTQARTAAMALMASTGRQS